MTPSYRTALEQAREAITDAMRGNWNANAFDAAIASINAALSQPPACEDCQGEGIPTFEYDANGNCGTTCPSCGSMPAWMKGVAPVAAQRLADEAMVGLIDAFGAACHNAGQHEGTDYMTLPSRRELRNAISALSSRADAIEPPVDCSAGCDMPQCRDLGRCAYPVAALAAPQQIMAADCTDCKTPSACRAHEECLSTTLAAPQQSEVVAWCHGLAAELWAMAQTPPGCSMEESIGRMAERLADEPAHAALTDIHS